MLTRIFAAAALVGVPAVIAQTTTSFSGPVLGYVFDGTERAIRVIGGLPGAAGMDGTLPSAAKLRDAHIAPGRSYAVIETIDGDSLAVLDWSRGNVEVRPVPGALSSATTVSFSPNGEWAAVYSKGAAVLQIWSGLPASPTIRREIAADVDRAGVSDTGVAVAIGAAGLLAAGEEGFRTAVGGSFAGFAFRPGSTDLAVAYADRDEIALVRSFDSDAAIERLAGAEEGIAGPVALQFSSDGATLAVANSRGQSAVLVDVATRAATSAACECTPSTVAAAAGRAVFRITGPGDGPIVFVDADAPGARTFLVPGGAR